MRILPINNFQYNYNAVNCCKNFSRHDSFKAERKFPQQPQQVGFNAAIVNFGAVIKPAKRLGFSNYSIFTYIKEIAKAREFYGNKSVVDMSMGNPDLTPPENAKQALQNKMAGLWSHRYNNPKGEGALFYGITNWMKKRFHVKVNPKTDIMVTSGSSDAIDHILSAYADYGDKVLLPNPGYALYQDLAARHDLKTEFYTLKPENGFLPDFSALPKDVKIMLLNYPHNPTGTAAPLEVFENAVKWAKENNVLLIHDMDNSEVTHTGKKARGILEIPGAEEVAFQVHTFSKSHSMPGFRVAFAVSDKEKTDNLLRAKFLSGGSVYTPVQAAALAALKDEEGYINKINGIYNSRKNAAVERMRRLGSDVQVSEGTYYLWAKVPPGFTSDEFFKFVLHKTQVAFTPGTVFGTNGEGYIRIVMSVDENIIHSAFDKLEKAGIRFDVHKNDLPKELQNQINQMADSTYKVEPKENIEFEEYKLTLEKRRKMLTERFVGKDVRLNALIPAKDIKLPWNILKDGQSVYLQKYNTGTSVFAEIRDIPPFSSKAEYENLAAELKQQWGTYSSADILPPYKSSTFYDDTNYFILKAEDKIQATANVEMQNDGCMWIRSLNSAPWNQGADREVRGYGTSVMARIASFCLETGQQTLKLATVNPEYIRFYKKIGAVEDGTRNFNGVEHTVLKFDKNSMELFLNKFQTYLVF